MTMQETELLNSVLKELAEIKNMLARSSGADKVNLEKGGRLCVDKIQNQQGFPQLCKAIT
ncbi:hypothetical protein, partial [Enterobacter hormaechei]|uniref:hypothetical protein n=1 Tax=Enterobacter hormaechei TaxID=158836 RepID=UPI003D6F4376